MKNTLYILFAISLVLVTSCTNDLEQEMNDGKITFSTINASMGDLPTSRVHLENDGKVVWDVNDQIGIFSDTQITPVSFTCTSVDESKASFSAGDEKVSGNNFVAYYPYNKISVNNNIFTCSLQDSYLNTDPISKAPMIAESSTNEFKFKHTCGFLHFSITGSQKIKQLTLRGNNYEKISGKGTIDIEAEVPILSMNSDAYSWINLSFDPNIELSSEKTKDFYFIVPVGKFTKGLTLEITYTNDDSSTTVIKKTTNKYIEVSRSIIKSFSVFDTDELIQEIAEEERIYGALMAFYNGTGGENWKNKTNWGDKNVPYSEWYGLNVSYIGNDNGKITGISMNDNNLKGSIPKEIVYLKDLNHLYMADNEIDSIPSFLSELSLLENISMGNCKLSGTLPKELALLKNLKMINLPNNNLSGNIDFLGNLSTTIESLDLQSNKFSGTIPTAIGNLTNLYNFTLDNNEVTGNIPKEIGNINSLKMLQLGRNGLEGTIPEEISKLDKLE